MLLFLCGHLNSILSVMSILAHICVGDVATAFLLCFPHSPTEMINILARPASSTTWSSPSLAVRKWLIRILGITEDDMHHAMAKYMAIE